MFWTIVLWAASFVLNLLLTPKPQNAKPASLEDFTAPVAEEGLEIPVLFGTTQLKGPNVVWYGDLLPVPIKGPRRYGLFGPRQVTGYQYKIGMHMVLCHCVPDAVIEIWIGDKLAWDDGATSTGPVLINQLDLFGGDQSEGGIYGYVDLRFGEPTQAQESYLAGKQDGATTTAYRGVLSAVLMQVYVGTSTYIKPWEFFVKRIHKTSRNATQWYDAKAAVPDGPSDVPTGTGTELLAGQFGNSSEFFDTNGNYAAMSASANTTGTLFDGLMHVWDVSVSPPTAQTLSYTSMHGAPIGQGCVLITDFDEVIVRTGGNAFGSAHTYFEFRNAANLATATQSPIDLNSYIVSTGNAELNFGAVLAEYGDTIVAKLGPSVYSGEPWIVMTRSADVWGVTASHTGASGGHSSMDVGPTYAYAVVGGSKTITRVTWNGVWSEDQMDLSADITGGPDNITAVCYSSGTNEVVVLAADLTGPSYLYVYNEDLTALQRSSVLSGVATSVSRRMAWGAGSVALFVGNSLQVISVADFSVQRSTDLSDTSLVNTTTGVTWFYPNDDIGGYLKTEHAYDVTWWPAPTIDALDMNPSHIIRECLTDATWGMGYNDSDIDDDSFTTAADTLYDEFFGLTLLWTREETIEEFISVVLSHIDAYLYVRRDTGKFYLKLIRDDYVLEDVLIIDEDDVISWEQISHRQPGESVNSVTVKYTDRRNRGNDASHQVDNIAQIQQFGERINSTRSYPGISRGDLAVRVAERDVRSLGSGLVNGTIVCKRTIGELYPGDVFRLVSSRHQLDGEVMRVINLEFGDGRENQVTIEFVEDVFRLNADALVDTSAGDWENPVNPPEAVTNRLIWEMPYREAYQMIGPANLATMLSGDSDAGMMQASGQRPTSDAIDAYIYEDGVNMETMIFSPAGFIDADVGAFDTSVTLEDYDDLDNLTTGTLGALVGTSAATTEIVKVTAISVATLTLQRGMLDTIPQEHSAGTAFLAFDDFGMTDFEQRTATDTVTVQLATHTLGGVLSLALAPSDVLTYDSRAIRPFRPANVEVEGFTEGPVDATGLGDIDVTWSNRNRSTEISTLKSWTDATVAVEAGQTTVIEVLDPTNTTILTTHSGLSGTSYTVPVASFSGNSSGWLHFGSERDGYREWQHYEIEVLVDEAPLTLTGIGLFLGLEELVFQGGSADFGAGSSSGTGTGSGVGASTAASVGSAAGVGDASAEGEAAEPAGSSAGVGTGSGVGASTAASVGSATGVGGASGNSGLVEAAGSAAGVGTGSGVGGYIVASAGSASGVGSAAAESLDAIILTTSDDVVAIVNAGSAGDAFYFTAGTYRGVTLAPQNGQTFTGDDGAILNGSVVLSSWTSSGGLWYASGQTQQLAVHTGAEFMPGTERPGYRETLFIDDVPQRPVAVIGNVVAGTFFLDYDTDRLYISVNPSGHTIEAGRQVDAFNSTASGVTIDNLVVEKYCSQIQDGAIRTGTSWIVRNCEARLNFGLGISVRGDSCQILDNYIHDNGEMGTGGSADDILVEGNDIADNGYWSFIDPLWEGGGFKFSNTNNLTVRGNFCHGNNGSGMWTDINNINTLYEDNVCTSNTINGVSHEISYDCIIRNNTFWGNGYGDTRGWGWGSDINIQNSQNVEVYGNQVEMTGGGNGGIVMIQQNRGTGTHGTYLSINNNIHDNIVVDTDSHGTIGGYVDYDSAGFLAGGNVWTDNAYYMSDSSSRFQWNGNKTFAQFVTATGETGFRSSSTYDTSGWPTGI